MTTTYTYELAAYPKKLTLRDGREVIIKPMLPDDREALLAFFREVPGDDRYYLKEDVASPEVIGRWAAELDYRRALPLLAWSDAKVVADASLHATRTAARRHVGEARIVVHPAYRNQGLGTRLLQELAIVADDRGLEKLILQAVAEREEAAIKAAEYIGFVKAAVLPGHAKERDGQMRDIVVLELPIGQFMEWFQY